MDSRAITSQNTGPKCQPGLAPTTLTLVIIQPVAKSLIFLTQKLPGLFHGTQGLRQTTHHNMKTIYFVRHAKSSWEDLSLTDFDRPLNRRGLRDAPFMGKLMHAKGLKPDQIITSPAVRAKTTAQYYAEALEVAEEKVQHQPVIYEAFPEDIYRLISGFSNEWKVVYLFGHNPTWTTLANAFSSSFISNIPTCGTFRVDAEVDDWAAFTAQTGTLSEFHYPKQYFS